MTKSTLRKSLSIIIAAALLLALLPAGMIAFASSGSCGSDLVWILDSSGNLSIIGSGDMTDYYSSSKAPWGTDIKTVSMSDGITSIGYYAFANCTNISSVTIPDSVTKIGENAFSGCTGLTSITIPDSVVIISKEAFENTGYYNDASNWEDDVLYIGKWLIKARTGISGSYLIKDGTVGIAASAFDGCTKMEGISIPEGVTSLCYSAFSGCSSLKSAVIPNSVTNTGNSLFYKCTSLANIKIGNGITEIGMYMFSNCSSLTNVGIPNSVKTIGMYSFAYCESLISVTIPSSVTGINKFAFTRNNYDYITIYAEANSYIANVASQIYGVTLVTCNLCGPSLRWIKSGTTVVITGEGDMYNYSRYGSTPFKKDIVKVVIGDGVSNIGERVFQNCTGLTSVTIPNSVTSIGWDAFDGCTGLTSVTIPDSVTSIGEYAFYRCAGLTSVTIPDSVTSIGYDAFAYCDDLTSITVESGNPVYHSAGNCIIETESKTLILGCKNSIIPSDGSVTSIGDRAFYYCTCLTSISIPNSVTSIGDRAFYYCTCLTSVTIGNGVTSISEAAFHRYDWNNEEYSPLDVTLRVYENSYAHQYALDEGFKYELIKSAVTKGDADGDGKITVGDALSALRIAARIVPATEELIAICDIDGDGKVTVGDALSILRVAARIVASF